MKMIKNELISVILYDECMQGTKIDQKLLLHPNLEIDVKSNTIGLRPLKDRVTWNFQTNGIKLIDILENERRWHTNQSAYDWLIIERYVRELFESYGLPENLEDYVKRCTEWYTANRYIEEPTPSTLRQLVADLSGEYSCPASEK